MAKRSESLSLGRLAVRCNGASEGAMTSRDRRSLKHQAGKIGYILLWLIGVPIPILILIYLLRGCT
jgi:hypothetical protein